MQSPGTDRWERLAAAIRVQGLPLLLALAAAAAGCSLGPDYVRPQIQTPVQYRFEPATAAATVNTAWWQQFEDPVLDELIAQALAHNLSVQAAAANVEQAAALLTQTRSGLYPQVGYSAAGERARSAESELVQNISGYPNPRSSYNALLSASWELDLWGRIARQSEAARANLLATDAARNGVILSLVAAVANSYMQLRGLDEQLVITRRTLGAYAESLRLYRLQYKYGQTSKMTVSQVQSQYESAAAQIPQLESQIAQVENALSVLLGRNPGPIPRGKSIYGLKLPPIPAGLPSELLERRPDLLQAEQELIAANAQIGAAKALYFPAISLTGALGGASVELSSLFSGPARIWSYAGQAVGSIFSFGAISGQVAQAEAQQQAALLDYRLAVQNAFADVENALVANEKLQEQVAAQERLVAALKDYARLAKLQFDGGYTAYTTVLLAEQTLFPAELALAAQRASLFASAATTYKAMGGGWKIADGMTGSSPAPPAAERGQVPPVN